MDSTHDTPPPAAAPKRSRAARVGRALLWTFAGLVLLLALALAGGWWWFSSNQSLAFALAQAARHLPAGQTLESEDVSGSLRAGGHIGRLRWQSPTLAVEVRDARIGWHLPALWQRRLELGEVHAAEIAIEPRGPKSDTPPEPLQQLLLPIEVDLPFRVDTLRWAGPPPLVATQLAGRYRYVGAQHRLAIDGVDLADGHYSGEASLDGAAPMALDAKLEGRVRAPLAPDRSIDVLARARVQGPLAGADALLQVAADLEPAEPGSDAPMQAHLTAELAPWDPQPVRRADAQLKNVDTARLWPEAPATRLSGELHVGPQIIVGSLGWHIEADLRNDLPGPWDEGKLPLERLQANIDFDGRAWTVNQAQLDAGGGRVEADGRWSPAPDPWRAKAQVRGVRLGALHTQLAGAPVSGSLTAEQAQDGPIAFDVDLQAAGGAGAAAPRDALQGLPVQRVAARGQWQAPVLDVRQLRIEAADALLQGQLRARPADQSASGKLDLSLPGATAQLQAELAPAKGEGSLKAEVADAATLQRSIERLPGLASVFGGTGLQGKALLNAQWTGGWQTLQRRFSEADIPLPRGSAEPTLRAQLQVPRLELRPPGSPATGEAPGTLQLRAVQAEVAGSFAQAKLTLKGEAITAERQFALQLDGSGGLQRANQWQARLETLRAQVRPNARTAPAPWTLVLQQPLDGTVRTAANGLQFQGSGGAATLTGPVPGTVRIEWQPTRFTQSGAAGKRSFRLQSKGRLQGLPMAWTEALTRSSALSDMGITGDLVFEGDWDIDAGDTLRAQARLARASGDIRVQAGEAAMVRRLHSTGTGTAAEITMDAQGGSTAPSTPAGLRQAELKLDAQGDTVRATLAWDSERAGTVKADASSRFTQSAGGWQWPADAPLAARVQAKLPNLGVWSMLAPPGWRVAGTLDADATLSGTRNAPRWTGRIAADQLALRAAVEGLDLRDGKLRATLAGDRLTIDEFTLKGGAGSSVRIPGQSGNLSTRTSEAAAEGGTLSVRGEASWSALGAPGAASSGSGIRMDMRGELRALRVLVRSDRQITLSGDLQAGLDAGQLTVRGKLRTDRGVIILPAETAPSLGSDVVVTSAAKERAAAEAAARQAKRSDEAITQAQTRKPPDVRIELDLGKDFAVQGRGITTRLEGQLEIQAAGAGSAPRINGEVRTVRGVYRAYGQQMDVETGIARFNGPYDNPQLDILALRPNITQRAGVQISGTAQSPRVKLYSEPPLSDAETLSWVMLGRASAANGGEAILMQQAALAVLGKLGANPSGGNLASRFGLDEIGFKGPSANGELQESAVTLGKRLSKDFYVTYERSLAGTVGTLYLFYDLTQRLTLRGQAGEQYGADLIYTIKYD